MVNVDMKQLAIFALLAKQKHFAQTATAFHMTPSAVTRSIQKLEQALDVSLFDRSSKQVELTQSGIRLLNHVELILTEWQEIKNKVQPEKMIDQGEIALFSSVTATYTILPIIFDRFRSQYPLIEIHLSTGDQAQAIDKLRAKECDLAVTAKPDKVDSDIVFKTLTYSPLRFIMPRVSGQVKKQIQQQLKQNGRVDFASLPLIVAELGIVKERLLQWFSLQRKKPDVSAIVSGHEAIISLVALGCGIGLVPEIVLQHSPLRQKVTAIDTAPELEPLIIGVCALEKRIRETSINHFWQIATIMETFKSNE